MDFKDYFDEALAVALGARVQAVYPNFDRAMYQAALPSDLAPLAMKARVRALSDALWQAMDLAFPDAATVLCATLDPIPGTRFQRLSDFPVWVIADVVECHGVAHPQAALQAIHKITRHFTGEFAIRPYLARYPDQVFAALQRWLTDPDEHVRRLVSEGVRPRLPWASRVPALIENPAPVINLLENLYLDASEYVRRSVANNLNDISKDHPQLVIDTLAAWREQAPSHAGLAWITGHALRSLCRQGHAPALALLGYASDSVVNVSHFSTMATDIGLGESINLRLDIHLPAPIADGLMIDYELRMPGANGRINQRVFKWSKRRNLPAGNLCLQRRHAIVSNSTRRYYPGEYQVTIKVNGHAKAHTRFRVHP